MWLTLAPTNLDFFTYFVFDVHLLDSVAWFTKVSGSLSFTTEIGPALEGVFSIIMSATCLQRNARNSAYVDAMVAH